MAELILAFDAFCGTCQRIAQSVADTAGDQVAVLPLDRPDVLAWRVELLGADPPWAPTLIDVAARRAWVGRRLGPRLAVRLGPRRSWRLLREIGSIRIDQRMAAAPAGSRAMLSRSTFLRTAASVVAGAAVVGGSTPLTASAGARPLTAGPTATTLARTATSAALLARASAMIRHVDVENVVGADLHRALLGAATVTEPRLPPDLAVLRVAAGGRTPVDESVEVEGDCVVARSADHGFGRDRLVSVSVLSLPRTNGIVTLESFDPSYEGVRSRARRWEVPDDATGPWAVNALSVNGSVPTAAPAVAAAMASGGELVGGPPGLCEPANDPCGGCATFAPGADTTICNSILSAECLGGPLYACVRASAACGACVPTCRKPGAVCVACLFSLCPFAVIDCCGKVVKASDECVSCGY